MERVAGLWNEALCFKYNRLAKASLEMGFSDLGLIYNINKVLLIPTIGFGGDFR